MAFQSLLLRKNKVLYHKHSQVENGKSFEENFGAKTFTKMPKDEWNDRRFFSTFSLKIYFTE